MWELDYKESWVPKNWCFWTVVLKKTLESPLDCKEIQAVHPKGYQSWVFIGRTDVKAETPILWPPDRKADSFEKTLMLERLRAGEGDNRRWDSWMASPTQWTWVWVGSGSWWWAGRPGMLWFMGSQRVGHDWTTELNWTELNWHRVSVIHWKAKRGRADTTNQRAKRFFARSWESASLGGRKSAEDVFLLVLFGSLGVLSLPFSGFGSHRGKASLLRDQVGAHLIVHQDIFNPSPRQRHFVWWQARNLAFLGVQWMLCFLFAQKLERGHVTKKMRLLRRLKRRIRASWADFTDWAVSGLSFLVRWRDSSGNGELGGGDGTTGWCWGRPGMSPSMVPTRAEDGGAVRPWRCSGTFRVSFKELALKWGSKHWTTEK